MPSKEMADLEKLSCDTRSTTNSFIGEPEATSNEVLVSFESDNDPTNPLNWSTTYKWSLTVLISTMSLSVNLAILMSAPATPQILAEFNCTNELYGTLLISIWELGEVFGPLMLGPLSEVYGRLPVYHVTTILFVIFSIAAARSTSIEMLIGLRFLLGINVASVVLNPCIVGDMFRREERGKALSVMGMVPYVAPCLGPLLGGVVSHHLGWRWTFWLIAIITGSLEVMLLFLLRETYPVAVLQRKVNKLRKEGANARVGLGDGSLELPSASRLWVSIARPIGLMFTVPIMVLLSICCSIGMSACYVVVTTLTYTFESTYHFSEQVLGLSYFGLGLGMVFGIISGGYVLDKLHKRKGDAAEPESRLPLMAFSYFLIPTGMLIFGWTARPNVHWIVPIIGTFFVGSGFTAMTLASWAYLIDVFGVYSASATAAVTVVRNAAAATLPLAEPPLRNELGLGLGYTVLASIAFALSPAVFVLLKYGTRLRGNKTYATG